MYRELEAETEKEIVAALAEICTMYESVINDNAVMAEIYRQTYQNTMSRKGVKKEYAEKAANNAVNRFVKKHYPISINEFLSEVLEWGEKFHPHLDWQKIIEDVKFNDIDENYKLPNKEKENE